MNSATQTLTAFFEQIISFRATIYPYRLYPTQGEGIYMGKRYFRVNLDEMNKPLMRKFKKSLKDNDLQAIKCDETIKGHILRDYLLVESDGTNKVILKNKDL